MPMPSLETKFIPVADEHAVRVAADGEVSVRRIIAYDYSVAGGGMSAITHQVGGHLHRALYAKLQIIAGPKSFSVLQPDAGDGMPLRKTYTGFADFARDLPAAGRADWLGNRELFRVLAHLTGLADTQELRRARHEMQRELPKA